MPGDRLGQIRAHWGQEEARYNVSLVRGGGRQGRCGAGGSVAVSLALDTNEQINNNEQNRKEPALP